MLQVPVSLSPKQLANMMQMHNAQAWLLHWANNTYVTIAIHYKNSCMVFWYSKDHCLAGMCGRKSITQNRIQIISFK